jgi:copper transport protein
MSVAILLICCATVLRPSPASAHANLVTSDPPAQAVLARAPARVQLSFSEDVEPREIEVEVLNAKRERVDQGDAALIAGSKTEVAVSLKDGLPQGVYTVQWKMLSAVDGHVTRNLVPFTVGDPGAVPEAAVVAPGFESGASSGGLSGVVARWLNVLASVVLAGGFAFVPLMLVPALRRLDAMSDTEPARGQRRNDESTVLATAVDDVYALAIRRVLRIVWITLVVLVIAAIAVRMVETATAADGGLGDALGRRFWDDLTSTRRGALWLWRMGLIGLIVVGLTLVTRDLRAHGRPALSPWWGWAALAVLAGLSMLFQALGSHSAALRSQESLATAIDWVHLLAVSVWIGGLVMFGLALLPALAPLGGPPRTRLLAGLIPRFSLIAGASVGVIALTGVYQTWRLLGGWSAFTEVGWGQALLVKLVLFGALLLFAGFNLFIVSPWMRRLATRMDRPAREVAARVRLHFRRALLGEAAVAALVLLVVGVLTGQSPREASSLVVEGPFRPIILDATADDLRGRLVLTPGRIGLNRFDVSVAGTNGRPVPDGTEALLRISTIDRDTGVNEAKLDARGSGNFDTTGSYLSTVGLWEVAVIVRRPNVDEVKIPFQFSLTGETGQVQVRENRPAAPIERGREIYQANCAQCHGAGGRGDGPVAAALMPRPLDLTVHVPLHTDSALTDFINNGVARTAMQAWKGKFTDEEIQAIINYLRQVAEQTNQNK